tara:strand:+ start:775 stop:1194 length:420 start_codon:yes stop_codon:yes gene_type:complete
MANIRKEIRIFKDFLDEVNYRQALNEEGDIISPTSKRKTPNDHLYFLENDLDFFGLHVAARETSGKFTHIKNKLVAKYGCEPLQVGDFEGNFRVSKENLSGVASLFGFTKRVVSEARREALREQLKAAREKSSRCNPKK